MFGKNVDVVDHYQKKLEKLEDDMRLKQSLLAGEVRILSLCGDCILQNIHSYYLANPFRKFQLLSFPLGQDMVLQ